MNDRPTWNECKFSWAGALFTWKNPLLPPLPHWVVLSYINQLHRSEEEWGYLPEPVNSLQPFENLSFKMRKTSFRTPLSWFLMVKYRSPHFTPQGFFYMAVFCGNSTRTERLSSTTAASLWCWYLRVLPSSTVVIYESKSTRKLQLVSITTIRFLLSMDQIFLGRTEGGNPPTAEVHPTALVQDLTHCICLLLEQLWPFLSTRMIIFTVVGGLQVLVPSWPFPGADLPIVINDGQVVPPSCGNHCFKTNNFRWCFTMWKDSQG